MLRTASLLGAVTAAVMCVSTAAANDARIIETSDSEIIFELATDDYSVEDVEVGGGLFSRVVAPGYVSWREEGLPLLPRKAVLLGIPFGAEIRLDVVSTESENLGVLRVEPAPRDEILWEPETEMAIPTQRFSIDEDFYETGGTFPPVIAELSEEGTFRHQRVVRVVLSPFQYSPRTGSLTLHRRIRVRVTFPGEGRRAGLVRAVAIEPEWERTYSRTVLNHEQAASWRMRPEPRGADSTARQVGESYRLRTLESGMHRLDYSEFAAEGLGSGTPIAEVAVYQRAFDAEAGEPFVETPVAVAVFDVDSDGYFDDNDYLLFPALSFEQQRMPIGYEDRYSQENAYWFGADESLALRMSTRSGALDQSGLPTATSFSDTLRFEEDVYFDASPDDDYLDLYTWTDYSDLGDNYHLPFVIHDIDPDGNIRMRARYQGIRSGEHTIDFSLENGSGENDFGSYTFYGISETMAEDIYLSGNIPAAYFEEGENVLHAVGEGGSSGANLDWFEFQYDREFVARDGRLGFTNASLTGLAEFTVTALATDAVRLFDITDPWNAVQLELGEENVSGDGDYALTFQDDIQSFTRYEVVEDGSYHRVTDIERCEPSQLATTEADLIVISYDGFASTAERLLDRRRSEGWQVAHALVSDVYDDFGGGIKSLDAIRDYLRYAFNEWSRTPQFVLLVGDASEDTRGLTTYSQPDYIPTVLGHGGGSYPQMTASDQWFVSSDDDLHLPYMFIGRLPVGSVSQLDLVISKILLYESYSASDEWRKRTLFVADDQWKYATLGGSYFWSARESGFTDVSLEIGDMVKSSPAGLDTTVFALRRYTTPFHESNGISTGSQPFSYFYEVYNFVDQEVTPAIQSEIADGAAIVNFQGHGNRDIMTHEQMLQVSATGQNDVNNMGNEGKPFIFMGFSCHLAGFHDYMEQIAGECIVEQMLFLPSGRGAVASFACSGAAILPDNESFNTDIFSAFFEEPTPAGSPDEYFWPRWTLGSILGTGTVNFIIDNSFSPAARTYVLLGDPLTHVEMSPPSIQVTLDGAPLVSGEYLEASGGELVTFVADFIDEVEIDPESITVEESDSGVIPDEDYTVEAVSDTLAELGRWYRVTYQTEIRYGLYDLRFSANDVNGQESVFVVHVAEGENIVLRDVINHPNPFATSTKIIFQLTQSGASIDVSIYTVGGRLIRRMRDIPGELNYNEIEWDGFDQDGDRVANGLYLYVVEASGADGTRVTSPVGRMVKAE